jgi:hypothetical protein
MFTILSKLPIARPHKSAKMGMFALIAEALCGLAVDAQDEVGSRKTFPKADPRGHAREAVGRAVRAPDAIQR